VITDRGLLGEHHRVRAVVDRVGDVRHLGSGRPRGPHHGGEHLGRGDRGLRGPAGEGDQPFLGPRDLLDRQLDAEIAAGDHDPAARRLDDLLGPLRRLRLLDLRDQRDVRSAVRQALLDRLQVGGAADERDGEQIDPVVAGEVDPGLIGGAGRRQVGVGARQIHALMRADRASGLHLAGDVSLGDRSDSESHPAVGQEHRVPLVDRPGEALPLDREKLGVPGPPVGLAAHQNGRAGVEDGDTALQLAEPELRSREVADDPHLPAGLLAHRADPADVLGVLVGRGVGEVEPEDVDPRIEQLAEHLRGPARRTDRGDDLRAAGVMRGCAARRNPF
jgi:hypothetical protein